MPPSVRRHGSVVKLAGGVDGGHCRGLLLPLLLHQGHTDWVRLPLQGGQRLSSILPGADMAERIFDCDWWPTTRASLGQCSLSTTTEAAGCSFQTPTTACLSPIISSTKDASRCVRMERNFCGIEYTACDDTINPSPQSFSVSGSSNTGSQVNFPSDCQLNFLKF